MSKFIMSVRKLLGGILLFIGFLIVILGYGIAFAANLPDHTSTPGALNPAVNQANIKTTICVPNYTSTIRPKPSYTTKLKLKQLRTVGAYASTLGASSFEEDHLISLEIGGNPTSEQNLWPQHWSAPFGAHQKDQLENKLHRLVCSGTITLVEAQQSIASNWIAAYQKYITGGVK